MRENNHRVQADRSPQLPPGRVRPSTAVSRLILLLVLGVASCDRPSFPSATAVAPPPQPAHATDAAGAFRLDFELPRTRWAEREAITGEARLALTLGTEVVFSGSGTPVAFEFREVDGDRWMAPAWTADCARHALTVADPMRTEINTNSGSWGDDDRTRRSTANLFPIRASGCPVASGTSPRSRCSSRARTVTG